MDKISIVIFLVLLLSVVDPIFIDYSGRTIIQVFFFFCQSQPLPLPLLVWRPLDFCFLVNTSTQTILDKKHASFRALEFGRYVDVKKFKKLSHRIKIKRLKQRAIAEFAGTFYYIFSNTLFEQYKWNYFCVRYQRVQHKFLPRKMCWRIPLIVLLNALSAMSETPSQYGSPVTTRRAKLLAHNNKLLRENTVIPMYHHR